MKKRLGKPTSCLSYLSWDKQVESVSKKVARSLGRLSTVKHLMPLQTRKTVFPSLILPHFIYCCSAWSGINQQQLLKLQRLMNRMCRYTLNIKNIRHPTQDLYRTLDCLPQNMLFDYHIACDMYKYLHNIHKCKINFPPHNRDVHMYPTRGNAKFQLPMPNLQICTNAFSIKGPKLWNNLPDNLKILPTLGTFKKELKSFLRES